MRPRHIWTNTKTRYTLIWPIWSVQKITEMHRGPFWGSKQCTSLSVWWRLLLRQAALTKIQSLRSILSRQSMFLGEELKSYPDAILLSVRPPIMARVTEHEEVACDPIRAAVSALGGDGCNLRPLLQLDFQPLVLIRVQRGPASGTCGTQHTNQGFLLRIMRCATWIASHAIHNWSTAKAFVRRQQQLPW